jgi:lipopolysaccharide transport system permease protein
MSELPCTVYTSDSQLRHPGVLARLMVSDLVNSRELAWRLFVRDISAQYRQSVLGYIWVFIPPLVASLPFIYLNSQGVVRFGHTPIPYAAYAGIGAIIWQTFVDALNAPLKAVVAAKPVLTRVNLPREAILLSALAQVGLGVLVRLPLLIGFMVLTPVVYPPPHSGLAAAVSAFNPLTPLITTTRDWLTVGATGNMTAFLTITAGALLCLLAGWVGVRVAMPHLIARIGS